MRIEPKAESHLQPLMTECRFSSAALRPLDTMNSYQEQATSPAAPAADKSPLYVIMDLCKCVKFLIIFHAKKLMHWLFSCFFTSKPATAPPRPNNQPSAPQPASRPGATIASTLPISGAPTAVPAVMAAPLPVPANEAAENAAFSSLPISAADKDNIAIIVRSFNAGNLFMNSGDIIRRGDEINPVHPFRFLESIFTDSGLSREIQTLKSRTPSWSVDGLLAGHVWSHFVSGLKDKLNAHLADGTLICHINAFARSIGRDPAEIQTRVTSKNWAGLIDYLIDTIPLLPPLASPPPNAAAVNAATLPAASPPLSARAVSAADGGAFPPPPEMARIMPQPFSAVAAPQLDPEILEISELQRAKLARLFHDIAHNNYANLFWNILSLRADWYALRDVHPLKLLLTVFNDPALIVNLRTILDDPLKKEEFLKDFASTLKHGATPDQLKAYLDIFARRMRVAVGSLDSWVMVERTNDWKHVIRFLLNTRPLAAAGLGT